MLIIEYYLLKEPVMNYRKGVLQDRRNGAGKKRGGGGG